MSPQAEQSAPPDRIEHRIQSGPIELAVRDVRLRNGPLQITDQTTIHGYCTLVVGPFIEIENCAIGERHRRLRICMPRLQTRGAGIRLAHDVKVQLGRLAKVALAEAKLRAEAVG